MPDDLILYRLTEVEAKVLRLEAERRRWIMAGLSLLGGTLVTLASILWSYRATILR